MRNQRETLIKCLRAYRTTSYHSLLALSGFSPLHIRVLREYQQSHLNRVNVPEDEHLEQLYSLQNIVHPSEWKHLSHVCHETEKAFFKRNEPIVDSVMSYYTDGSKSLEGTGAAFILVSAQGRHIRTKRFTLHPRCDVFQAELFPIERALSYAREKQHKSIRICTDSLSSLLAIENYNNHNHLASTNRKHLCEIKKMNTKVELEWV